AALAGQAAHREAAQGEGRAGRRSERHGPRGPDRGRTSPPQRRAGRVRRRFRGGDPRAVPRGDRDARRARPVAGTRGPHRGRGRPGRRCDPARARRGAGRGGPGLRRGRIRRVRRHARGLRRDQPGRRTGADRGAGNAAAADRDSPDRAGWRAVRLVVKQVTSPRLAAAAAAAVALCAAVGVMAGTPAYADVTPSPSGSVDTSTLLDPNSDTALLNLLGQQGVTYYPITVPGEAIRYADGTPDTTLVISEDERLSTDGLAALHRAGFGRVVILNNDAATISAFLLGAGVGSYTDNITTLVQPSCTIADPVAAGSVDLHTASATFTAGGTDQVASCYPANGAPTLIYQTYGGADAYPVVSTPFFENDELASAGNAALALRLFGAHSRLLWLAPNFIPDPSLQNCSGYDCGSDQNNPGPMPTTTITAGGGGGGGSSASRPTLTSLMPSWIWWALLQLLVAVLLVAYWRGR